MLHSGPNPSIALGYIPLVGVTARIILAVIVLVIGESFALQRLHIFTLFVPPEKGCSQKQ